jgi:hypothetical protein
MGGRDQEQKEAGKTYAWRMNGEEGPEQQMEID